MNTMDQFVSKFDIIIQYYEELKIFDNIETIDETIIERIAKSINLIANKCMDF